MITEAEVSEGAETHAARDAILTQLGKHYKVPVDVQATEAVLRERDPRAIAHYRPGIGEAGTVTITLTR